MLTLWLLGALASAAPAANVAHSEQALLLVHALAYDRTLARSGRGQTTVLVLYRQGSAESDAARETMASTLTAAAETARLWRRPLKAVTRAYTTAADLSVGLAGGGVDAVYLCPGVDGAAAEVVAVTRSRGVLTFAGNEAAVRAGVSIGFVDRSGRVRALVNLAAAGAEGADLDSAFLGVAEVIR